MIKVDKRVRRLFQERGGGIGTDMVILNKSKDGQLNFIPLTLNFINNV